MSDLATLRSAVEWLALPGAEQVESVSRRDLAPGRVVRESRLAIRSGVDALAPDLSPVLGLRLEALERELGSMEGLPDALAEEPAGLLQHASWVVLRQLAQAALREPGWPTR